MGSLQRGKLLHITPVKGMPDLYSLHISDGVDNHFFYVNRDHIRARCLLIGDSMEFEVGNKDHMRAIIDERTGDEKVWTCEV